MKPSALTACVPIVKSAYPTTEKMTGTTAPMPADR
jgi:hypothetical protein